MFCKYFLVFIVYSCLGWLMEVILTIVKEHKFVNRGFLIGPCCPIYGWGALMVYLFLYNYRDKLIILFFMAMIICAIFEYLVSYVMEKLFHARWWDYSKNRFNINGRICLETTIPFGIFGVLDVKVFTPLFMDFISKINYNVMVGVSIILFIIYVIDTIVSGNIINKFKNEIKNCERDMTEEIANRVRYILGDKGYLYRRVIKAFPNMNTYRDRLNNLRKRIDKEIDKINRL